MTAEIHIRPVSFTPLEEAVISFSFGKPDSKILFSHFKIPALTVKRSEQKIKKEKFEGKENQVLILESDHKPETIVLVGAGAKNKLTMLEWRRLFVTALKAVRSIKAPAAAIRYISEMGGNGRDLGKNLVLAMETVNYAYDRFKSQEEKKRHSITSLDLYCDKKMAHDLEKGIEAGQTIAASLRLTRDLVNEPASHLHPETLVQAAFDLEKMGKGAIKVEVLDEDECRRLGMGAFLGVAQGSKRLPKFIILKYQPEKAAKKICLIGKSITFDSGGLSLKPADFMMDMKIDMAGGATVLGVFRYLAAMDDEQKKEIKHEIIGLLPACENMPSGRAMRPGDVVTAINGKTIEVLNTDAEGRLTLADALSYAEKHLKPDVIIDLATLTGACMVALGEELAGFFCNNEGLEKKFSKIAKDTGDALWPLPLYEPYAKSLKSKIADLKNIGGGRYGGAITAALFLKEFVSKTPWAHIDIAGPAHNEGEARDWLTSGGTGWGVVSLIEFVKEF